MSPKSFVVALIVGVASSACVAPLPYDERVAKTPTYQKLDAQLLGDPAAAAVRIEQLPHLVRLTLSDALFSGDDAQPNELGKALLARLGPALHDLGNQRVVVKSFTGSVSVGVEPPERFPSTVPMTQARAAAVAGLLQQQGVPATYVYASGLGDSQLIALDDTPQARATNRRVVIDIVAAPA